MIETQGRAIKWAILFQQRVTGLANLTNSPRGEFVLPGDNRFSTFAARTTIVLIGSLTAVKIRFGFTGSMISLGLTGPGMDMTRGGLGWVAAGDLDFGSVGYAIGAVQPPDVPGGPFAILPPVGRVLITAPGIAGRDFTYQVLGACVAGWP